MRLSIVIPLLNEEKNLPELHRRLVEVCGRIGCERQIIFVDDGSTDGSVHVMRELSARDPCVVGLRLSRNFGHEAASTAGLDQATGDAAVLMDADLQDPPELLEKMVELWRQGNDIVYAVRNKRFGESKFKRWTSWAFYRFINKLSDVQLPEDTGDFRLMDRKVLDALKQCRETERFIRGLVAWVGYKSTPIYYDRPARHAGETKYGLMKLLLLSLDAVVGFSILPLRLATALGFMVTLGALTMAMVVFLQKLFVDNPIPGYPLLTTGLFFLGGVQMLLLGIVGEYLGRVYRQAQNRPLYLLQERIESSTGNGLAITNGRRMTNAQVPMTKE
jgi:polyisoprenyl-phosphate glycosyltransferase